MDDSKKFRPMGTEHLDNKLFKEGITLSSELYNLIINSLQDYAIFTMGEDLHINSWTAGSAKIFGYTTGEIIGQPWDITFTEEDRKSNITKTKIEAANNEGRVADGSWHVRKDGSLFYSYGVILPLRGKDGESIGFIIILRDLTERKESEDLIARYVKELQERNAHKDTILTLLSHDLRSPLSGIIQLTELLKDSFKTMDEQQLQMMLDQMYELTTIELRMLDNLVKWASIKYASEAYFPSFLPLRSEVTRAFDRLKLLAESNNIYLNNAVDADIRIFADERMLHSILQNLVSNGIKHSLNGGEIIVGAKKQDDMILVHVRDFGKGMSKEILDKMFTPHVTALLKAGKEQGNGAGIGLLLVKSFVEKIGGEIWVESIESEGTSFYFTLPTENPMEHVESSEKRVLEKTKR